jgi:hypothetical protein
MGNLGNARVNSILASFWLTVHNAGMYCLAAILKGSLRLGRSLSLNRSRSFDCLDAAIPVAAEALFVANPARPPTTPLHVLPQPVFPGSPAGGTGGCALSSEFHSPMAKYDLLVDPTNLAWQLNEKTG